MARRPGFIQFLAIGCGCLLLAALGIAAMVAIGVFAFNNMGGSGVSDIEYTKPEGLSSTVPPNFASLFTEAGNYTGVAPAMIAAIYLTEHHSDTFGEDLPSLDYKLSPCTENSAGAAGPMQFIPSSWDNVVDDLQRIGISSPDRCRFRDSIIGAGFLLKGKLGYEWVQEECKTTSLEDVSYTDGCVSRWGQSYCGIKGCHNSACGAPGYLYCEEVVRKYKLVVEQ